MKKKNIIYIIVILLLMFMIAIDVFKVKEKGGLFSIFNFEETSEKKQIENILTEIEINEKLNGEYIVYLGDTLQLTLKANIATTINAWNYNWLSTDQSVASVSTTGSVYGKKIGETTIRVTNKNDANLYDIVKIKVIERKNKLEFSNEYNQNLQLIKGEIKKLNINVGGSVVLGKLEWISSDENICMVNDGYLYAKENGQVTITVKSLVDSKYFDMIHIEIYNVLDKVEIADDININAIYINNKEISGSIRDYDIYVGDVITINSSCNISNNAMVNFSIKTDNLSYKSVESYVATVVCNSVGKATIDISSKYNNLLNKTLEFEIKPQIFDNLTLKNPTLQIVENNFIYEMYERDAVNLEVLGSNNILKKDDFIVEVANTDIAYVDNGYLIAKQVGETQVTIKYRYDETQKISFTLFVMDNPNNKIEYIAIENPTLNNKTFVLNKYQKNNVMVLDTISFNIIVTPYIYAQSNNYLIYSTNPDVASCTTTYSNNQYLVKIDFMEIGSTQIVIKFFDNLEQEIILDFNVENTIFDLSAKVVLEMDVGKTYSFLTTITNSLSKKLNYTYTSSNPLSIIIGNNGDMMAIGEGTSDICVTVDDGKTVKSKTFTVNVKQNYLEYQPVTKMSYKTYLKENDNYVEIDFSTRMLNVFQKAYMSINVMPNFNNANNYQIITSNPEIISITYSNNMYQLYALSAGSTTIYIKNYENSALDLCFDIKVCEVLPKYLISVLEKNSLSFDEYQKINLNVDPNATFSKVTYRFSTPNVIKIINNTIVPLHAGKTTVIIEVDDHDEATSNYYFSFPVEVLQNTKLGFMKYSTLEIISFIFFHLIIYGLLGIYFLILFKNLQIKKVLKMIAIIIIPLAICCFPELLKLEDTNKNIIIISILFNSLCCGVAIGLTDFIMKCKGKNQNED